MSKNNKQNKQKNGGNVAEIAENCQVLPQENLAEIATIDCPIVIENVAKSDDPIKNLENEIKEIKVILAQSRVIKNLVQEHSAEKLLKEKSEELLAAKETILRVKEKQKIMKDKGMLTPKPAPAILNTISIYEIKEMFAPMKSSIPDCYAIIKIAQALELAVVDVYYAHDSRKKYVTDAISEIKEAYEKLCKAIIADKPPKDL